MKYLAFVTALFASPAAAHVGHLGGAAGHDHWIAGIAIGIAAGITLWGLAKGRKPDPEEAEEDDESEEETA